MPNPRAFLKVDRNQIQNETGEVISLHGVGLGGWMNMENFITGFPANENCFSPGCIPRLGKRKGGFFI